MIGGPAAAEPVLLSRMTITPPPTLAPAFGGISGLDYDPESKVWRLISDDRSERAPSRFYVARIRLEAQPRVRLLEARPLRDRTGRLFPKVGTGQEAADAESLRYDRRTRRILWSSEGDFADGYGPQVRWMDRAGKEVSHLRLPPIFARDPEGRRGPRPNRGIEGLALSPDGAVWASMEAPFIEDGELPTAEHGAAIRLTRLDPGGGPTRQYVYAVDPVRDAPPAPKRSDNGVSEILALDNHRLLVIERSGRETEPNRFAFHCRLYLADLSKATDVATLPSLEAGGFVPAAKTLLFDFDALAPRLGNVEAMAWAPGPGRRLVVVTDDNFDPAQPTELLVLELDL